jgi:hypothetical protein
MQYAMIIGLYSTANLIENNIIEDMGTGIVKAWGASGNVFAYNYYPDWYSYDDPSMAGHQDFMHGMHTKMNLSEGNEGPAFVSDFYWGSHSYNTAFRNYWRPYQAAPWEVFSSYRWAVQVFSHSRYYNIVGNVLGHPNLPSGYYESNGPGTSCNEDTPAIYFLGYHNNNCGTSSWDSQVKSTMLRHGNYDYITASTKWCGESGEPACQGSDQSHAIPDSLYLPAKPAWWCAETPWPPIGSDLTPKVSKIPAQRRYEGLTCFNQRGQIPNPPLNLKVQ